MCSFVMAALLAQGQPPTVEEALADIDQRVAASEQRLQAPKPLVQRDLTELRQAYPLAFRVTGVESRGQVAMLNLLSPVVGEIPQANVFHLDIVESAWGHVLPPNLSVLSHTDDPPLFQPSGGPADEYIILGHPFDLRSTVGRLSKVMDPPVYATDAIASGSYFIFPIRDGTVHDIRGIPVCIEGFGDDAVMRDCPVGDTAEDFIAALRTVDSPSPTVPQAAAAAPSNTPWWYDQGRVFVPMDHSYTVPMSDVEAIQAELTATFGPPLTPTPADQERMHAFQQLRKHLAWQRDARVAGEPGYDALPAGGLLAKLGVSAVRNASPEEMRTHLGDAKAECRAALVSPSEEARAKAATCLEHAASLDR